eukprot:s1772_g12.t1
MRTEKELPAALECNARSEEQGLCEELEPAETWEQSASSFSPQALGADLAKEVAGVSFMQEGIERADALPRHLHKVLMDSMVSVPMFLALFTLVMLWARCTVALTSREQKEPSTPSAVDAWCVQGAEAECDAKWLCHELMVPRNSRCAVTVPRMLKEGPWTAVVSDKMGQCMFKVCTTEVSPVHPALNMHGPRTILHTAPADDEDAVLLAVHEQDRPHDQEHCLPVQLPKAAIAFLAFLAVFAVGVILATKLRPPGYGEDTFTDPSLRHSSNLDEATGGIKRKAPRPENMCKNCKPCADQLSCVRIVDDFFQNAAKGQLGHLAF